jgi:molybdenum cofactor guanylyltransferase
MESVPIGIVLAGGEGRRLGGAKAKVELCGRPLISYPLAALRAVLDEVVVLAKDASTLPDLPQTAVWIEREPRQHPLAGLTEALALAGGRPVVACAVDLPLLTPELVRRLIGAPPGPAVVASHKGQLQPLLGRYSAQALAHLRAAAPDAPLREVVAALEPGFVEVGDGELLLNVNTPGDLRRAAEALSGRPLSRRSPTSSAKAE